MGKVVLVAALLVACVHRPPLSAREQCAGEGMLLAGVSSYSSSSSGVATTGGTTAWARGASYDEGVSCRRPETHEEKCEVTGAMVSRDIKLGFAERPRNVVIGAGYILFVVPGLLMYMIFSNDKSETHARAKSERAAVLARCLNGPH
jgi:hypothetical protein